MQALYKGVFLAYFIIVSLLLLMPLPTGSEPMMNDKIAHILIFFVMSFLVARAYPQLNFIRILVPLLICYGACVELLQGWSGYRQFSLLDLAADAAGIFLYLLVGGVAKKAGKQMS